MSKIAKWLQASAGNAGIPAYDVAQSSPAWSPDFALMNVSGLKYDVEFNNNGTKMYVVTQEASATYGPITEWVLSTAYDITTATFNYSYYPPCVLLSAGIGFANNGTKMYINDNNSLNKRIYEFTLSTGYDLSTATFGSSGYSKYYYDNQSGLCNGIFFKPDGTKLYLQSDTYNSVDEYALSTAWDITTASYTARFDVSASNATPASLNFNNDGTKFYVANKATFILYQYNLTTAYDVTTASYSGSSFDFSAWVGFYRDFQFKPDGTKLFIFDDTSNQVKAYNLSTAWDLSTVSYYDYGGTTNGQIGLFFKTDGTRMFHIDSNEIREYQLLTGWNISTLQAIPLTTKNIQNVFRESSFDKIYIRDNGTDWYMIGSATDTIYHGNPTSTWDPAFLDFATQPTSDFLNYQPESIDGYGAWIKEDGTRIYISSNSNDRILQYNLGNAYDIDSAVYNSMYDVSVATGNANPRSAIKFNSTGTKWWVTDTVNDVYEQYTISAGSAYDITASSYDTNFDYSRWTTNAYGAAIRNNVAVIATTEAILGFDLSTSEDISTATLQAPTTGVFDLKAIKPIISNTLRQGTFNDDGTSFYIVDTYDDLVRQYNLSTAYDITTMSNFATQSVLGQSGTPAGLCFADSGSKMYIIDTSTAYIYMYNLSTPYNVGTATYSTQSYLSSAQGTNDYCLVVKEDGTKMWKAGISHDKIYEYSLSTAYNVTTATYTGNSFTLNTPNPISMVFSPDGLYLVVADQYTTIEAYTLSTAYDITTATLFSSYTLTGAPTYLGVDIRGITFNPDGKSYYVVMADLGYLIKFNI